MKAYITMLGRSTWAMVNAYYATVMNGYKPNEIYIFLENAYKQNLPKAVEALKIISEAYDFSPKIEWEIIEEDNFLEADEKIGSLLKTLKEKEYEIAMDITSGRKALVAGATIHALPLEVEHLFYLSLRDLEYASRPYMMIPLHVQRLKDFMEGRRWKRL
ncbi:hypothetical protein K1720_02685 [Thermococcus argininiproducens]|uniref:Uncharacterized protein n=1 Tax=Thermococcus argininiproducens TaxID=2866384 RepID=A0A9E7MBE5_9EURY|nr:hypothetical protein [Thermococcus argininiproducens]USH00393.1 hypothetical protein K1720_02685 [Thermococcus argininiproducens]